MTTGSDRSRGGDVERLDFGTAFGLRESGDSTGAPGGSSVAGPPDRGSTTAGVPGAGSTDASFADAGSTEAGFVDAGPTGRAERRQRRRRDGRRGARRPPSGRSNEPTAFSAADDGREADPVDVARSIVLRQLTGSAKSRSQLEQKLADRQVPEAAAEAVLDRFEDLGLIDDREFARAWVRSRVEYRHLARPALRRELTAKGIDRKTVDGVLEEVSDEQEYEGAVLLVRRKLSTADLAPGADRQRSVRRLVGMLGRKGYPPGVAFRVVHDVLAEAGAQVDATDMASFE